MADPVFIVQDILVRLDDGRVVESQPVRVVTGQTSTDSTGKVVASRPVNIVSGGAGISPTSASVPANSPAGTVVTQLMTSVSGATLSVVSGPFTLNGSNDLVLSQAAGAAGSTQTARIKAERSSPFYSVTQDIVVTALPALAALTLTNVAFALGAAAGTVIGAIQGKTTGSTLAVFPADGRVAIDGSGNLVVGLSAATAGTFDVTIRETLGAAANSPRSTTFTLTVGAAQRFASAVNAVLTKDDTSAYTNMRGRVPVIIGSGDLSELALMAYGWKNVLSTGYVAAANAYTIVRIAIEKSGGGYAPVTFGGAEGITISPGDTDVKSDPVLASAFGLAKFSKGEVYYVRYELSVASAGQALPYGGAPNGVGGVSWRWFNPASTSLSPVYGTGAISVVSGTEHTSKTAGWAPIALGRFLGVEPLVYYGGGDSIMQGVGDVNTGATVGNGFFARQMVDADGVSNYVAGFNGGSQGTTAAQLVANTRLLGFMKYANRMISELGTNDININSGAGSITTLQTNLLSIWASARAAGIQKILHTYITPNTSSTDTWMTLANQTPYVAAYGLGGKVQDQNAWIASKVGAADGITVAVPVASVRGSSDPTNADFYKWVVDGMTANYATGDRVHPNAPAAILMANDVRTARIAMG